LRAVREALGSPWLRRILVAYTINRLGTWFAVVALSVSVYDHTHSALAVAALLFAGQALPALVVPAIVARVERRRGKSEVSRLYLLEAVATAVLAVLVSEFSLPLVLLFVAIDGAAALAASALLRAEVARTSRDYAHTKNGAVDANGDTGAQRAERAANAALNTAFSTTFVLGPVLGGVVVAGAGASAALLIDVASFVLGAVLLMNLRHDIGDAVTESVRSRLSGAWRHINEVAALRGVLIAEFVALVFIESGGPIEVTFVKGTLNAGDRGLGLLLTSWGVGSVLGSIAFARMARRPLWVVLSAGTLAIAGAYFGLALAPSLGVACAAGLLGGIGNGMQWPSLVSVVQNLTPGALQGRLMGAVESLGALCLAIGLPLGGMLVALSSPRVAFVIVGTGAALATLRFVRLPTGEASSGEALVPEVPPAPEQLERTALPPDPVSGPSPR